MRIKDEIRRICKIAHDRYPDKYIEISGCMKCHVYEGEAKYKWDYALYIEDTINHEKLKSLRGMKAFLDAKLIDDEGEA